jgi:hypothetical protein
MCKPRCIWHGGWGLCVLVRLEVTVMVWLLRYTIVVCNWVVLLGRMFVDSLHSRSFLFLWRMV